MTGTDIGYYERRIKLYELEKTAYENRAEYEMKMLDIYHGLWYDYLTERRYNHNHDPSNGRFCSGISLYGRAKIEKRERRIVSSAILTDHPNYEPDSVHSYDYGDFFYRFTVKGYGNNKFHNRRKLIPGNKNAISFLKEHTDND